MLVATRAEFLKRYSNDELEDASPTGVYIEMNNRRFLTGWRSWTERDEVPLLNQRRLLLNNRGGGRRLRQAFHERPYSDETAATDWR
ncbi:hypothetical protein M514_07121 [Trichuris suis]|uniref:Uncharacterized protein n=1 Tax=Trichuris suis TaxID=68888 RepID=A0A085M443_9BILA|nr:hypothetical protein M513_07121 [Trichuris suis]KFD71397.1 hypothetical protein M514_07121 [Trichuris suis]